MDGHSGLRRSGSDGTLGVDGQAYHLLLLTPSSFEGEGGKRLAAETLRALREGCPPILLYAPERGPMKQIIDASPPELVSAGLYGKLAIEWRDAPSMRPVSLRLVAKALGAQFGRRWDDRIARQAGALLRRLRGPTASAVAPAPQASAVAVGGTAQRTLQHRIERMLACMGLGTAQTARSATGSGASRSKTTSGKEALQLEDLARTRAGLTGANESEATQP